MYLIVSQAFTLLIIFFLLYVLTWFLPTDSPWTPWWTTSTAVAQKICKLSKLGKKDVFYELGSGTGTTVIVAAKEFGARAVGIESSKSRVWWSRMKAKRNGVSENVTFLQKDFFTVSLSSPATLSLARRASPPTVVYLYLVPRVIKKLKPKLLKELKPGTKVISHMYEIDYLPLLKEDNNLQLYVYKIP